jgi:hypothetical protein
MQYFRHIYKIVQSDCMLCHICLFVPAYLPALLTVCLYISLSSWNSIPTHWRTQRGGFGGLTPPQIIPKFWQSRADLPVPWKINLKNLINYGFHLLANWAKPLTRGLPPPRSLFSLPSVLNWICWTPPPRKKFLGTPVLPLDNFNEIW